MQDALGFTPRKQGWEGAGEMEEGSPVDWATTGLG